VTEPSTLNNKGLLKDGDDNIVGVSRLQLCDGQQWKDTVDVCLELLSPRNQGPNSAQGQNCSFGMMKFERRPRPRPAAVVDGSALEPCRPQRGLCSIASSVCSDRYTNLKVVKVEHVIIDDNSPRTA